MAGPFTDDRDVLSSAREGSDEAGRRLMETYGPSMLRTAWHVLGRYGGQDAEDVVQEAFIAALTTPALPHGDIGGWLRAIAARKALDSVRAARRHAGAELPESLSAGPVSAATMAVRSALLRLSPTDRAVIVLVELHGHSMAEAAAILGTTNLAVRLRAMRARRKLAGLLKPEGPS